MMELWLWDLDWRSETPANPLNELGLSGAVIAPLICKGGVKWGFSSPSAPLVLGAST